MKKEEKITYSKDNKSELKRWELSKLFFDDYLNFLINQEMERKEYLKKSDIFQIINENITKEELLNKLYECEVHIKLLNKQIEEENNNEE